MLFSSVYWFARHCTLATQSRQEERKKKFFQSEVTHKIMDMKVFFLIFAATFAGCYGLEPTNYDLSRNRLGNGPSNGLVFKNYELSRRLGDASSYAGSYGQYYPNYPSGPGYYPGGNYQGNYPGGYNPGYNPGVAGPPGAHPGCPLCDSSVYSYCSYKQAHDACCCDNPSFMPFTCRKSSCGFLYANSCQEYHLISSCCCVDLYKNGAAPVQPPVPVAA
ncbi:hypothetical protein ABMA27_007645 [Loxostege sticticalis]|uniref:CCC domain-containing protein n=1 Tax=Loxostege sticticalis TaxID=481309 RepID=A0ABR3HG58_LOXSC